MKKRICRGPPLGRLPAESSRAGLKLSLYKTNGRRNTVQVEKLRHRSAPQPVWCRAGEYTRACGKKGSEEARVSIGTANVWRRAKILCEQK